MIRKLRLDVVLAIISLVAYGGMVSLHFSYGTLRDGHTPDTLTWYALILLAFLPFLPPAPGESPWRWLAVVPWLYLSAILPLSYLTYLNPLDFRELEWVRQTEWLPTLGLLAVWMITSIVKRWNVQRSNALTFNVESPRIK